MNQQDILNLIINNAREVLPSLEDHTFQPDDALKDLGANSIDRSEIVMMTLEDLCLKVPLIELAKVSNIGELASALHERL